MLRFLGLVKPTATEAPLLGPMLITISTGPMVGHCKVGVFLKSRVEFNFGVVGEHFSNSNLCVLVSGPR